MQFGELRIAFRNETPILSGGIAFETLDNSVCLIDDVEIRQAPRDKLAGETEPPVEVAAPAAEPEALTPAVEKGLSSIMPFIGGGVVLIAVVCWSL